MSQSLFCDGGVIKVNPSPYGGTWAWCLVDDETGAKLRTGSGVLTPKECGTKTVSNNVAELWAALEALRSLPDFDGSLFTDSQVTRHRLVRSSAKFVGVPNWIAHLVRTTKMMCSVTLVAGHPTRAELRQGYRTRNRRSGKSPRRYPVSVHNVWADRECQRLAKEFMKATFAPVFLRAGRN